MKYTTASAAMFTSIRKILAAMMALALFFRTLWRVICAFAKDTSAPNTKPTPPANRYISTGSLLLSSVPLPAIGRRRALNTTLQI